MKKGDGGLSSHLSVWTDYELAFTTRYIIVTQDIWASGNEFPAVNCAGKRLSSVAYDPQVEREHGGVHVTKRAKQNNDINTKILLIHLIISDTVEIKIILYYTWFITNISLLIKKYR